jgi:hypothetical protein
MIDDEIPAATGDFGPVSIELLRGAGERGSTALAESRVLGANTCTLEP